MRELIFERSSEVSFKNDQETPASNKNILQNQEFALLLKIMQSNQVEPLSSLDDVLN